MNEGGSNQPMPLVHNGIIYLTHTLNMVQALDAATAACGTVRVSTTSVAAHENRCTDRAVSEQTQGSMASQPRCVNM